MNKKLERYVILGLLLTILVLGVWGCANKPVTKSKQPSVYDGSLGLMLGCIFDPSECDKIKKNAEQEEITKEWEEIDEQNSHK